MAHNDDDYSDDSDDKVTESQQEDDDSSNTLEAGVFEDISGGQDDGTVGDATDGPEGTVGDAMDGPSVDSGGAASGNAEDAEDRYQVNYTTRMTWLLEQAQRYERHRWS